MELSKEQKIANKKLKSLTKYYQEMVDNTYNQDFSWNYIDTDSADNILSDLGFVKIKEDKDMKEYLGKVYNNTKYFNKLGIVLEIREEETDDDLKKGLDSMLISFLGYKAYKRGRVEGSGGAFSDKRGNHVFYRDYKETNIKTPDKFLSAITNVFSNVVFCEKPEEQIEMYYFQKLGLLKNFEDIEIFENSPEIQDYIYPSTIESVKKNILNKDTSDMFLFDYIPSGYKSSYSIKEWDLESTSGFLGNIADETRNFLRNQKSNNKKRKAELNEDLISKKDVEFIDLCYNLVQKRIEIKDIDPEWLNYKAYGTFNMLNVIGKIGKKDIYYDKMIKNILDITDKKFGREILRDNIFCVQNNCMDSTPFEKIFRRLDDKSSLDNEIWFSCMSKIFDLLEPSDLTKMVPEGFKQDTDKEKNLLDVILYYTNGLDEKVNNKNNPLTDLIAEKTCLLLSQLSEKEKQVVSSEINNHKNHFIMKSYDKTISKKESEDIKTEISSNKKPRNRRATL